MSAAADSPDAVTDTDDPDVRLAVTTNAETFQRLRDPLSARGIAVEYVPADERVLPLTEGAGDLDLPDVDVGWVYPSRLMEGAVLDARLGVSWVNGREVVLASRNKAGVIARLADAGVPVPETAMVSNPADEAAVLAAAERVGYPLVVKPNSTTRGVGIATVADPDSLLGVTDYLDLVHDYRATGDKSYLIQEFLPDARDYRVMVLEGAYAGAVERRLSDDDRAAERWKHNVHRGAVAEGVDLDPAARGVAERAAGVLNAPLLGVDLLESDGRLVVSETNARPTVDEAEKYEPGFLDDLAALVRRTARGRGER